MLRENVKQRENKESRWIMAEENVKGRIMDKKRKRK